MADAGLLPLAVMPQTWRDGLAQDGLTEEQLRWQVTLMWRYAALCPGTGRVEDDADG